MLARQMVLVTVLTSLFFTVATDGVAAAAAVHIIDNNANESNKPAFCCTYMDYMFRFAM